MLDIYFYYQLERLILLTVGVGKDMEPENAAADFRALGIERADTQRSAENQRKQK